MSTAKCLVAISSWPQYANAITMLAVESTGNQVTQGIPLIKG